MPAALTRTQLAQELLDAGHHYLGTSATARVLRMIDLAAEDILHGEPWPQRRLDAAMVTDSVGAIPVTEGLGDIVQVIYTTTGLPLTPTTEDTLYDNGLHEATGAPTGYYVDRAEQLIVTPIPPAGTGLIVRSRTRLTWQTTAGVLHPAASVVGGDVLLGGRGDFDEAVTIAARLRAIEDTDEVALRDQLQARLEAQLARLRDQLLNQQVDEPLRIKQTRPWV